MNRRGFIRALVAGGVGAGVAARVSDSSSVIAGPRVYHGTISQALPTPILTHSVLDEHVKQIVASRRPRHFTEDELMAMAPGACPYGVRILNA